jgi:hypothetical protein
MGTLSVPSTVLSPSPDPYEVYRDLSARHDALFRLAQIYQVRGSMGSTPAIGMDQYKVCFAEDGPLATFGVGPYFAVCMRGRTEKDRTVLGMCHTIDIGHAVATVKDAMSRLGCLPATIDTQIIGGEWPTEDLSGSLKQEIEILENAEANGTSGVCFNKAHDEVDLDVVLTAHGVFYSTVEMVDGKVQNRLFTPSAENTGIDL